MENQDSEKRQEQRSSLSRIQMETYNQELCLRRWLHATGYTLPSQMLRDILKSYQRTINSMAGGVNFLKAQTIKCVERRLVVIEDALRERDDPEIVNALCELRTLTRRIIDGVKDADEHLTYPTVSEYSKEDTPLGSLFGLAHSLKRFIRTQTLHLPDCDNVLFRIYQVIVLNRGEMATPETVVCSCHAARKGEKLPLPTPLHKEDPPAGVDTVDAAWE